MTNARFMPDPEAILDAVRDALVDLVESDTGLLTVQGHELSHVHRFGVYLERRLSDQLLAYGLTIDMDYDRHGSQPKRLEQWPELARSDRAEWSRFRPDLIVHHRGDDDRNVLVVEWKKNADQDGIKLLRERVVLVKQIYRYMLGVLVNSHDSSAEWCVVEADEQQLEWEPINAGDGLWDLTVGLAQEGPEGFWRR